MGRYGGTKNNRGRNRKCIHTKNNHKTTTLFICIWGVAQAHSRTLPLHCRSISQCLSTSFLWEASFSADRRQKALLLQYRHLHPRQISSDNAHRSCATRVKVSKRRPNRKAKACRPHRGTLFRSAHQTTSSYGWTSGGLTLNEGAPRS